MGSNSTDVAYGFGQMGSVFTNLAKPVYPPKDHVIVAIQCLADTTFSVLETETLDSSGPQFPTHQDDELASAGGPDANYLGVTEAAASGGGTVATGIITIVDAAGNALIKPGQIVLIGADNDDIDTGLDMDAAAGNITPVYRGPNKHYMEVVSISGGTYGTSLVVKEVGHHGTVGTGIDEIDHIDTSNTLYFLDSFHGAGGTTTEGCNYAQGMTIYGRWTEVQLGTTDTDGGIICYFGQ